MGNVLARILEFKELHNLNNSQLAKKLGVDRSTPGKWEKGEAYPSRKQFSKFAKAMGITREELESDKPIKKVQAFESSEVVLKTNVLYVPLVGQYAYGGYLSGYQDEKYMESLPHVPFPVDKEARGNYVCFELRGDSMDDGTSEGYKPGDKLFSREINQAHWQNKIHIKKWDFVIVHRTEGILFKRITTHNTETNSITLHSLNPDYPDTTISLADVAKLFNVVESTRPRHR